MPPPSSWPARSQTARSCSQGRGLEDAIFAWGTPLPLSKSKGKGHKLHKSPRLITPVKKPGMTESQCATGLTCSTGARVQVQTVLPACHSAIQTWHHGSGATFANTHHHL